MSGPISEGVASVLDKKFDAEEVRVEMNNTRSLKTMDVLQNKSRGFTPC